MNKQDKFEFTYVALSEQERNEILSIQENYETKPTKSETRLDRIRKLDGKVNNTATAVSLAFGIIGLLIFGTGLTMILEWDYIIWGSIVSIIGIIPIALAHPINKLLIKRGKKKYGAEILKLSNELLEIKSEK